jgi:acetyl esterase/lipase
VERIAYGPDPSQFGELTRAGADRVAVLIHGGFWRDRYDRTLMHRIGNDLAAAGWTTWNLEYRRLGSGGGYPATLEDVAAGIDALGDVAGLGCPERIVAIGHSAGGHLAAWAATREQPRVALTGVVAQAGVLDLALGHELRLSDGVVGELMGGSPGERPAEYAAASPRARLPLGVPALVVTGTADDVVPPRISREFAAAAREAGDDVVLHEQAGAGHMGHVEPDDPVWLAVRAWL